MAIESSKENLAFVESNLHADRGDESWIATTSQRSYSADVIDVLRKHRESTMPLVNKLPDPLSMIEIRAGLQQDNLVAAAVHF